MMSSLFSFFNAVNICDLESVRRGLENGMNPSGTGIAGNRPLHYACANGHLEVAQLLILHGANVSVTNLYGATPLHAAAKEGQTEIVDLLLQSGAHVDPVDMYGNTPLLLAIKNNMMPSVIKTLLQHGANPEIVNKGGLSVREVLKQAKSSPIEDPNKIQQVEELLLLYTDYTKDPGI